MVSRVFAEGRKGFEGGITTRKYEAITKCSNRTASRDLSDLVAKRIIIPLPGGGRTTRHDHTRFSSTSTHHEKSS
jgi:Fic family protein